MNTYQNEIKEIVENMESLRVEATQEEDSEVEVTQEDFEEITQEDSEEEDSEDEEEVDDEEDSEDEEEVDEEDVNGVSLTKVGSDKNPLCNDIIGNILDFTGLVPSFAFVSKQWKGEVQNQMLKECTIQSIIFPNTFQLPYLPLSPFLRGPQDKEVKVIRKSLFLSKNFTQIKNKSYARKLETYVRQLESWVNDDGEDLDLIDSPQIKKLPSKIFKDHLTNQDLDEKDIICLFTQEWREYFTSLRNRLHTIPLMFLFPNHFLDKINRLSEEWISSALNDVTWEDRLDVSKMSVFPVCDLYITVHIVQQTHLLYIY